MIPNANKYEELEYPNYVFAETHPGRIAGAARLFGVNSCKPDKAKILELGCGGGMNLLAHAAGLPTADFLGIDASAAHVGAANQLKNIADIGNVRFLHMRAEDMDNSIGEFDYIICHGLYSWVPLKTRQSIIDIISKVLAPEGVAYISYNTLPGWHIQNILRGAMMHRTEGISEPLTVVRTGKEFLSFAADLFPEQAIPLLQQSIKHLLETPDNYLYYDHLGVENHPLYFSEFVRECEAQGMMYLAESDLSSMLAKELPAPVQMELQQMAGNSLAKMEQYLDILRLRQFRKTLICHETCMVNRNLRPENLLDLSVSAKKSSQNETYAVKSIISESDFACLQERFPGWISVRELVELEQPDEQELFLNDLLQIVVSDSVEVRFQDCNLVTASREEHALSPLVRPLANFGRAIPNLRSETVLISKSLQETLVGHGNLYRSHLEELASLGFLRRTG